MKLPKTKSSNYSNSPTPNSYPQSAYRSFASQSPKASVAPKTQTDIEKDAFKQQQMEVTKLKIQAKYGTITPEGQKHLTILQAKMDGLLNSRLKHARRFSHNFANIPLRSPEIPTPIQAKLTIGEPGDKYEQEADAMASFVVQRIYQPQSEKLQRESLPEDNYMQMKPERSIQREVLLEDDYMQMKPMVQRRAYVGGIGASPDLETGIQQARGNGQPLAKGIRKPMEEAFRADFSRVKIHTDTQADQFNQSIQAKAFTTGQDVFFRQGAYEPGSRGGQELIAHELTHVVQQNGGGQQINAPAVLGQSQAVQRQMPEEKNELQMQPMVQCQPDGGNSSLPPYPYQIQNKTYPDKNLCLYFAYYHYKNGGVDKDQFISEASQPYIEIMGSQEAAKDMFMQGNDPALYKEFGLKEVGYDAALQSDRLIIADVSKGHFYALRKYDNVWWNYDSYFQNQPSKIGDQAAVLNYLKNKNQPVWA